MATIKMMALATRPLPQSSPDSSIVDLRCLRLFLLATQNPAPMALTQRLQSLQPRAEAPMLPLEAEIDTSGQGVFVWLDVKTIFTTVQGLIALRDWLVAYGVTHVAMEATGVYWQPVWHMLEDILTLVLANATACAISRGARAT